MGLVDVDWLRPRLGDPALAVVDCRWSVSDPRAGRTLYEEGHVPGAGFLDVDADLAAPPGERGRHPLPATADFERAARRAGIRAGSQVVAYDESGEGGAARLWWLLRHFAHEHTDVLDGGMRAWRAAGGPLESGAPRDREGDFVARPREGDTIDAAGLRERLEDPALDLLDARAPERYAGEREPIDPVAGHIPGARNVPYTELAPEGRWLPPAELRARLAGSVTACSAVTERGEIVAYCGSGVTACTVLLAAELAGLSRGRLYPGSWSEWCGLGLPAETGR
jgi:thiosulfate/3-mercaptopyruvate sulfurtransferase